MNNHGFDYTRNYNLVVDACLCLNLDGNLYGNSSLICNPLGSSIKILGLRIMDDWSLLVMGSGCTVKGTG